MILAGLVAHLKANISVTRIYPNVAPQGETLPVITIDLNNTVRARHYSAIGGGSETGIIETDFEVSVWAGDLISASRLAGEVIENTENYRGQLTDASGPVVVHKIADIRIDSEDNAFDEQTELYTHSVFLSVLHD